jgi:hypothetical protein
MEKAYKQIMVFGVFALFAFAGGFSLRAQSDATDDVESILDRLERRLQEQQDGATPSSEKQSVRKKNTAAEPRQKLRFKEKAITATPEDSKRLTDLANAIGELEDDIEKLAGDVQGTKQRVMEQAKINNFIEIEATLKNSEQAAIKALTVKIDGYQVYQLNDAAGLWIPAKTLPLYSGPMPAGEHKMEVEAHLVLKEADGAMPLNSNVFRSVSQMFALNVADGEMKKRWSVELDVGDKNASKATASLKTSGN